MNNLRLSTQQQLKEALLDQLLELLLEGEGQQLEMSKLATHCHLTEIELKNYFPNQQSITAAINGRLTQNFIQHLDLSTRDSLRLSWLDSLESSRFRAIVRLFIDASQQKNTAWRLANVGWSQFTNHVASQLGYLAVNQDLPWLLGKSILRLMNQRGHRRLKSVEH